ncbi:hypothetical protein NODU109028_13430 [Nocardioides dubius]|uniref:DUF2231 domain-containing protein n=1 Tax=Nocardioides dubius TaxID=317019 RepID=A0ABN1TL62_9ACTN
MDINGLPAHPLVIHAAVVFVPLAALLAVTYACVPRWRWSTRWPMIVVSAIGLLSVIAAWWSGRELKDERIAAGAAAARFHEHQERADILIWVAVVFFVFVLIAAWALGGPSALSSGRGARGHHAAVIEWPTLVMLVILSVLLFTMAISTGEAGARLVYGG